MVYPVNNFYAVISENYKEQADTSEGVSYIEKMDKADVSKAEALVKEAEEINIKWKTKKENIQN